MENTNRKRTERLTLRLSKREKEFIFYQKEKCKFATVTELILRSISQSTICIFDTKPLLEIAAEINKIGVNINQIAKIANTTGNISPESISRIRNEIDIMSFTIDDMIKKYTPKDIV